MEMDNKDGKHFLITKIEIFVLVFVKVLDIDDGLLHD
jgi:hypothetical protein